MVDDMIAQQAARVQKITNVGIWLWNVFSSIFTIFTVKQLMRPAAKGGLGFNFSTTLCALHFASCAVFTFFFMKKKKPSTSPEVQGQPAKPFKLPMHELVGFLLVNDLSIIFLNLSLLLNSVFIYQIFKLGIVPFVAVVEYTFFNNKLSRQKVAGIAIVLAGIFLVVNPGGGGGASSNVLPSAIGLLVAVGSVVMAGMQQISCRVLQKKYNIPPVELLDSISLYMALSMGLTGPIFDKYVSGKWVWNYEFNAPALNFTLLSCVLALSVNLSQFVFLGRFSATTFQVVGHTKTIGVLIGGVLFFSEQVTSAQWLGVAIAITGMSVYSMQGGGGK